MMKKKIWMNFKLEFHHLELELELAWMEVFVDCVNRVNLESPVGAAEAVRVVSCVNLESPVEAVGVVNLESPVEAAKVVGVVEAVEAAGLPNGPKNVVNKELYAQLFFLLGAFNFSKKSNVYILRTKFSATFIPSLMINLF